MKRLLPFSKQKQKASFSLSSDSTDIILTLDEHNDLKKQLNIIQFTKDDLRIIKSLEPLVTDNIEEITDEFYSTITDQPVLLNIIERHTSVERLKKTFTTHIKEMFYGQINKTYVEKRKQIAYAHVRIGLPTKWYMASFEKLYHSLIHVYTSAIEDPDDIVCAITTTSKLLNFEQQIVLEEYENEHERIRQEQEAAKEELHHHVSETAGELSSISSHTSESVVSLKTQSSETAALAKKGTELALHSKSLADNGKQQLQSVRQNMNDVVSSVERISRHVQKLNSISNQMNEVIDLVDKVSEQTNLLALNASIEATRAGEHGKGFAVVAREIRKLSTQTKSSTKRIAELIENAYEQNIRVTSSVDTIQELVQQGSGGIDHTDKHFNDIVAAMTDTKEQNDSIEHALKTLLHSVESIEKASKEAAAAASQLDSETDMI
ncbi:heam-based aerotactic trancducer [Alteribacillus persepolensis]|uniref:Heam-based aerotactic trancducer n=1 Tax=Alteribacillus persepolensis TaxID=568899 RepID=A0A1G8FNI1_9BACI|nr:globin-coupled sensor protein [Alteribacillus persepolensis]SDH83634.1 heam-based aerotactic trancducer [Alteribacillus persepolensis]